MTENKIYQIIKILASVGIVLALYILWQRYFQPPWQPCNISSSINCDAFVNGPIATVFGIPSALIGLIGYILILLSAIFQNKRILLGMTTFGLSFCAWLGYREIFELKVFCPVCLACQIVMLSLFGLALYLIRGKLPE